MPQKRDSRRAATQNEIGLKHFESWAIDEAIAAFMDAAARDPDNPEYHLNLARAHVRSGDYGEAMNSLGEYLRTETKSDVASRYERLFSSALDAVEESLIDVMPKLGLSVQHTGKAIQMWLEYRITLGRRPFRVPKPALWSAAVAYAVIKVNLLETSIEQVAKAFKVPAPSVKKKYDELVETLDLMASDYRYFTGDENPLDKLVEAAQLLDDLEKRFRQA